MRILIVVYFLLYSSIAFSEKSICYGTSSNGRLENGVKLPSKGNNFISYSTTAELLGRTYVHTTVKDVLITSYKWLETEVPKKIFKYAETGFQEGRRFRPHKTHRNGLSVDFMVPVINKKGKSVYFPTNYFNKLGYDIDFDGEGKYDIYEIDFEALAAHIVGLHKAAVKNGIDIWRVIFDPKLQSYLMKTSYGQYLAKNIEFSKKTSWVRHDEHYHVDFKVLCK